LNFISDFICKLLSNCVFSNPYGHSGCCGADMCLPAQPHWACRPFLKSPPTAGPTTCRKALSFEAWRLLLSQNQRSYHAKCFKCPSPQTAVHCACNTQLVFGLFHDEGQMWHTETNLCTSALEFIGSHCMLSCHHTHAPHTLNHGIPETCLITTSCKALSCVSIKQPYSTFGCVPAGQPPGLRV
jgi:hypothetical protein